MLNIFKKFSRVMTIISFIFILLGAWFVSIIVKSMGPQIKAENERTKWIQEQHRKELDTTIYNTNTFMNVDGIKFNITNKIEKDNLLILEVNVDTNGFSQKLESNSQLEIASFNCDVVPNNINYKEEEFNKALITENKNSSFALESKLGTLTTNVDEKTMYGAYQSSIEKIPGGKTIASKRGLYSNNIIPFRIVVDKTKVSIIRFRLDYSYKIKPKLQSTYTYVVI